MILLEHHKQAKREIVARFQQLAEVAEAVGMTTLARDIRNTRIPKLEAERPRAKAGDRLNRCDEPFYFTSTRQCPG